VLQHHVFPRLDVVKIERPEKFGGDRVFETYEEMEKAYAGGEIHPADLKTAVAESLITILAPVRDYLR